MHVSPSEALAAPRPALDYFVARAVIAGVCGRVLESLHRIEATAGGGVTLMTAIAAETGEEEFVVPLLYRRIFTAMPNGFQLAQDAARAVRTGYPEWLRISARLDAPRAHMNNDGLHEAIRSKITQSGIQSPLRYEQRLAMQSLPSAVVRRRGVTADVRVAELSLDTLGVSWRPTKHDLLTATGPLGCSVVLGAPEVFVIPAKAAS